MTEKYFTLSNGHKIPVIGLGTYKAEGIKDVVKYSIDVGYRLIDTAYFYENESEIGEALSDKLKDGTVKREELFIVSKLWNTQHHPEDVIPAIKASLEKLQLEYLDLFLVHWPVASKLVKKENEIYELEDDVPLEVTWKVMEECVKQGYAKSIGISNFNTQQMERIFKIAEIKPVVNQVECNPYFTQKKLLAFCKQKGLVVMAYSPFYAPRNTGPNFNLFEDPVIKKLAAKHGKTSSQIISRYLIQVGTVPLPKSNHPERVKENIGVFDFSLTSDEIKEMDSLNKNIRCTRFLAISKFKEYPFNIEF